MCFAVTNASASQYVGTTIVLNALTPTLAGIMLYAKHILSDICVVEQSYFGMCNAICRDVLHFIAVYLGDFPRRGSTWD